VGNKRTRSKRVSILHQAFSAPQSGVSAHIKAIASSHLAGILKRQLDKEV
jgi:hypothetical protein